MREGIGDDLRSGHAPKLFSEMRSRAERKHNPAGFARKVVIASAVVGVLSAQSQQTARLTQAPLQVPARGQLPHTNDIHENRLSRQGDHATIKTSRA